MSLIVVAVLGALWSGVGALLTANPCGAFGDACHDVGGTGDGFGWFVVGLVLCLAVAVVGIGMVGSSRRVD